MKTPFALCMALLCILCYDPAGPAFTIYPTSCSVAPYAIEIQQPDGSLLTIHATGNSIVHYTETTDGFTVIANTSNGYEYAKLDPGGNLVTSGILAHNEDERSRAERREIRNIPRNLRRSATARDQIVQDFYRPEEFQTYRDAARFPATGNQKVLVILIQYPDLMSEHTNASFDALMNENGYNGTGSFRDYFLKNSLGQLDLNADVFGWYTSAEDHTYYGYQNGFQRSRELMAEAIDAAEAAGVDFSQYDNDGDGAVDAVVGIHSGPGAEVGAQTQYIWSHRWTLGSSYERSYDGVVISDYMINPETRPWGMVGVGVFCHEFGHVLGLPDLYDTDNSSSGIGNWGLMSNGAWLNLEKTPANMNAWSKCNQTWLEPEVITSGAYSLEAADNHEACYRINTEDPNEYFLLENRQKIGNDAFLPGSGLAIWHVDEDKTVLYPASNNVNADENNKGVDLEEADGLFQLDTGPFQGDAGDMFPGVSGQTRFDGSTYPSSNLYNGTTTNISVTNIWENDGMVHFRLNDEVSCALLHAEEGENYNCLDGFYDQEVVVTYEFPPHDGLLLVNDQSFEITGSPQTVLLTNLPADGSSYDLFVEFSTDVGCSLMIIDAFTTIKSYDLIVAHTTCDPSEAGTTTLELTSIEGCDSTVTLTTTLLSSYNITIHSTTCSFDLAGTFTNVYSTMEGCDSIVTLINEYLPPDTTIIQATTCDPLNAGTAISHLVSLDGCDSIVRVESILLPNYNYNINKVSCDPARVGTETNVYETIYGCDSIVTTTTSLVETYDIIIEETTCDPSLTLTEIFYLETQHGCDSMVTIIREFEEFSAAFESSVNGSNVEYSNRSTNGDAYLWFFGDGTMSSAANPVHYYDQPGIYQVLMAVLNEDCQRMQVDMSYVIIEEAETSIDQSITDDASLPEASMMVYPNPTFGPIDVEVTGFADEVAKMSLYDMNGHLVYQEDMRDGNTLYNYDLSGIGPGIYVLQVASKDEVVNSKIFMTN